MCSSGDFINLPEQEEETSRCQVVWQIFIALKTLKGFLDGRVADVRPE